MLTSYTSKENDDRVINEYYSKALKHITVHLLDPLAKIVHGYFNSNIQIIARNNNIHDIGTIIINIDYFDSIESLMEKIQTKTKFVVNYINYDVTELKINTIIADYGFQNLSHITVCDEF